MINRKLIGMEGRLLGNSVTPETTGSGHAPGKRTRNGNQFSYAEKIAIFSVRKLLFLGFVPASFDAYEQYVPQTMF